MLYPGLVDLLDEGHARGMVTMVVSNGILLDERRLALLAGRADLLAVSIDGVPDSHNRIRGSERAFDMMVSRLEGVRGAGIGFGFIFTLTQQNAHELEWVARFAVEQGAGQLQIHALEEVGRAQSQMRGLEPDEIEIGVAWLEALRLQSLYRGQLEVRVDFVDTGWLRAHPDFVLADPARSGRVEARLAELVSPLIVEADGTVVPLQYGFPREYSLGGLEASPLRQLAPAWRSEGHAAFARLCRQTFRELTSDGRRAIVDWYRTISRRAAGERIPTLQPGAS